MNLLLALLTAARAHSPHDVCGAVGRGPDGVVLAGETDDLARYAADGTLDAHLPSPGGAPACIAPLGGSAWALVTDDGAWRSTDAGATWEALAISGAVTCAKAVGGAIVGGADGVWRVTAAGLERLAEEPVAAVAEGPDGAVYALDEGGALGVVDGGFAIVHAGPWNALAGGADVLVADGPGVAVWEDGRAMATAEGPAGAVALAAGADAWLAAGATGGVWVSRDRGASWAEESDGLEEHATGSGAPGDGVYWAALLAEEIWVAAAWEGLYLRGPGDGRWLQQELRTTPFTRGLQWLDDGTLLIAPYGSGLARGTPAALRTGPDDWVDATRTLGWPWLRDVLAVEGRWWAVGGQHLYQSTDEGDSWEVVHTGLGLDGDVVAVAPGWPADARVWAGGVSEEGLGALAGSDDGGVTWEVTRLPGCFDKPSALAVGEGVWVGCGGAVWRGGAEGMEPVALPEGFGSVLVLLADGDGAVIGGDGGLVRDTGEVIVGERVRAAIAEGEGWLVSTDDGLVRVGDGEAEPLGWPADDLVASLAARDGRLAAGTFGGAWVSEDGGATWSLATDHDRYDDRDATWFYDGWTAVEDLTAKAEGARVGTAGAVAEWRLQATALAVYGRGDGVLRVDVDGVAEAVRVDGPEWSVAWSAALADAVHTVRIEVLEGRVSIDGGERWRGEGAVPWEMGGGVTEAEAPPCGCGGGGAWGMLVGVGMAGWRRRGVPSGDGAPRRHGQSPERSTRSPSSR